MGLHIWILSCVAWPSLLSGEGGLDVFLPVTLDDKVQGVHIVSSSGFRLCLVIFKLLIPSRSPEILTVHAGQVKPYSLLPSFSSWKVALGPCSMPWSQSSQRYQAGPHLRACPCHLIEATEFQRECLQSKDISKGWNHREGSKGGANER